MKPPVLRRGLGLASLVAGLLALPVTWEVSGGPALTVGRAVGVAGGNVSVPVSLEAAGGAVAIQFDLSFDPNLLSPTAAQGGNALSNHLVGSNPQTNATVRVVVFSHNNSPLTNGVLVSVPFSVATDAANGPIPLTLSRIIAADARASSLTPVQLINGSVTVLPPIGPRLSALTRATDGQVSLLLNGAAGLSYVVQGSANLTTWTSISTNLATNATVQVFDPGARTLDRRFYRALTQF